MSAGTSPLFFLIVCFLVCSSDAQEKILAEVGQDVILPCKDPNINININDIAVKWIRPDQDPEYVLFYRDEHLDPEYQHESYQNRVDLQDKEMKDGDVSLILKNVTKNDTGTYECRVFEKGKKDLISNITLEVHLSGQENNRYEKIPADLGQDVILPCKVPNIINITSVVWKRRDLDLDHVLVYRNGRIDPDNQHPSYQNRVDLQDKDMKDGDVSLILKNVTMEDTGTYVCRVFQKQNMYPINIVKLEVYLSGNNTGIIGDGGEKFEGNKTGIIVGSVLCMILVAAAFVGFLIYKQHMKKNQHLPVPPDEPPAIEMLTVPEHHQNQVQLV